MACKYYSYFVLLNYTPCSEDLACLCNSDRGMNLVSKLSANKLGSDSQNNLF